MEKEPEKWSPQMKIDSVVKVIIPVQQTDGLLMQWTVYENFT